MSQVKKKTIFQNLLRLNPRVQVKGSVVPSAVTKEQKKHWKRNTDKSCQVRIREHIVCSAAKIYSCCLIQIYF